MNQFFTMPNIIRETSESMYRYSLRDAMFQRREVELVGEVNSESAYSLILQLRQLQHEDPKSVVTMYISSPGGEVDAGLALYDVMQAVSYPIKTVCIGTCASMAALLFTAGTSQRIMLNHSRLMIHDPLVENIAGSTLKIREVSDRLLATREITARILAKHTRRTLEEVYEKTAKDTYFSAKEALDFGLADCIIDNL